MGSAPCLRPGILGSPAAPRPRGARGGELLEMLPCPGPASPRAPLLAEKLRLRAGDTCAPGHIRSVWVGGSTGRTHCPVPATSGAATLLRGPPCLLPMKNGVGAPRRPAAGRGRGDGAQPRTLPSRGAPKPRLLRRGSWAKWAGPARGAGRGPAKPALDTRGLLLISWSWDTGGPGSAHGCHESLAVPDKYRPLTVPKTPMPLEPAAPGRPRPGAGLPWSRRGVPEE